MSLALRYTARSDRGLVRGNNEDSVYAGPRLIALADGMGGHAAGEVASQLMITALAPLDDDEPSGDLLDSLASAMEAGNESIAHQVEEQPDLDGMGTTLTAILFAGSKLGLIHVGDSRGYLLRDDQLHRITRDDTFVQTLVDEGRITAEQAHTHPQRSLIMKALTGHEVEPTLTMREAKTGDVYLLCSDGLSDVVSDETIEETLRLALEDLDGTAERLVALALKSGGPDNVTVAVARVEESAVTQSKPIVGGAVDDDDTDYVPSADTAAGRAAALRPPREAPRRVIAQDEPEPHRRGPRARWIALAAVLVLLIVGVTAALVGRSTLRSNYFVAETGNAGTIGIYRGMHGSIFGHQLNNLEMNVCLPASNALANSPCIPMRTSDLSDRGRASLRSLPDSGSLEDAQTQIQELAKTLLPECTVKTEIVPPPPATPAAPELPGMPVPGVPGAPVPAVPAPPVPGVLAPSTPAATPGPTVPGQQPAPSAQAPSTQAPAASTTVVTQTSTADRPCRQVRR